MGFFMPRENGRVQRFGLIARKADCYFARPAGDK